MAEGDAATIREVHALLDAMRDEIVHAIRQDQRSQLDFNLNIASRLEAIATRLSAHETMPSHPTFEREMNRVVDDFREGLAEIRKDMKEGREEVKELGTEVTNLRISYARAAGIAFAVALVISIAIQLGARLIK